MLHIPMYFVILKSRIQVPNNISTILEDDVMVDVWYWVDVSSTNNPIKIESLFRNASLNACKQGLCHL
jgi:hypothetical protein